MLNLDSQKMLASESSSQYAYRVLLSNIMHLDLEPGEQLSDAEISGRLGISRTPVREAIVRLVESRLVEIFPQRLSRVSRINLDYVDEGVFLRHAAEYAIMKEVIVKADSTDIAKLSENLLLQKEKMENNEPNSFFYYDNEFHRMLFHIAKKPWSWSAIQRVTTHHDRVRHLQNRIGSASMEPIYEDHGRIFDLIVSRLYDPNELSIFLYSHLTAGYRTSLPYLLEKYPTYFIFEATEDTKRARRPARPSLKPIEN